MTKSNLFTKSPAMHFEVNFRTLLFSFAYVSCIIIVSCNNDSSKPGDEKHNLSAEEPNIQSSLSNGNIASHEHFNASEKPTAVNSVFLEGGSTVPLKNFKVNDTTTSRSSVQNDSLDEKFQELESLPFGTSESNPSDKKPHKGRKGVEMKQINSEETPSLDQTTSKATELKKKAEEPLNNTSSRTTPINSTVNSINDSINSPLVNTQVIKQELTEHVNKSSNDNASSGEMKSENNKNVTTVSKSSLSEVLPSPRPKPEITRDDDVDQSSYSLTSTETDYVIPIVATIFAAPLLIVLGMFLYKRSKEFWERRHYRRMDFLIDGMYND